MPSSRRAFLGASMGLAALSLSACGQRDADEARASGDPISLVYANAAFAPTLDPSITANLETSRISTQILETLVRPNQDTGAPEPHLATDWKVSDDGLTYTFSLRRGVQFHDGTPFDAEAVRKNFQRWDGNTRREQVNQTTYQTIFRSSTPDGAQRDSIYRDCRATDEHTVVLRISEKYTPLIKALTQPAFGIGSPRAFSENDEKYVEHPVGTGPFTLDSWDGDTAKLSRFEKYWGSKAKINQLTFKTVSDSAKRYYELVRGTVHAYDQIGIDDFVSLARGGYQIMQRDPYAVSYVSINQAHPIMKSVEMRQAVAHALDRSSLVKSFYPDGTKVANDFTPALFQMGGDHSEDNYRNDSDLSGRLMKSAKYRNEELRFYYPTDVSLPVLQQPEAIFAQLAEDLTKAGLNIVPVPIPWHDGYLEKINAADSTRALALNGIMGTYRDPDDFVSPLFRQRIPQFGFTDEKLFEKVRKASSLADGDRRTGLYQDINDLLSEKVPAVPFAFPLSAVALSPKVTGYPLSATGFASFADVQVRS